MAVNKKSFTFKDIQYWLYENGFESGLAEKSLQKPLGVCATGIIAGLLWFNSNSGTVASYRRQLLEEKDRGKIVANFVAVSSERKALRENATLPSDADPKEWIQGTVSALAVGAGLEVVASESAGTRALSGGLEAWEWTFTFRGGYHSLGSFLATIENSSPAIGVSQLEFARSSVFDADRGMILEIKAMLFALQVKQGGIIK